MASRHYQLPGRADQQAILRDARVIALVGFSADPGRASHRVGRFLQRVGYTVYPVNPTVEQIGDDVSYPTLASVPEAVDIVNVFRRSQYLVGIVEAAIAIQAPVVWAQLGIYDEAAARLAASAGIRILMNSCIMVAYNQLMR